MKHVQHWSHMSITTTKGNCKKRLLPIRPDTTMRKKKRRKKTTKKEIVMLFALHAYAKGNAWKQNSAMQKIYSTYCFNKKYRLIVRK